MRIVAVGMVRNEADIVESFVRHTLRFADEIRLIDHLSTDRTPEILASLQAEGFNLVVTRHTGHAQIQEILTTALAKEAFEGGADWVIPLDCDEFIDAPSPPDLRAHLAKLSTGSIAWWPWASMVPQMTDDQTRVDPVQRIGHRRASETINTPKCLVPRSFASRSGWQFSPGNHHVRFSNMDPLPMVPMPAGYGLRHYPVRSASQLISKMVLGRLAWIPRLNNGSAISFHTRDFFNRLKSGWTPADQDLAAYAYNYQEADQTAVFDLVYAPLQVAHVLRYTHAAEAKFLPLLLDWAEKIVASTSVAAPPAVFRSKPRFTDTSVTPQPKAPQISEQAALSFNRANSAYREGRFEDARDAAAQAVHCAPDLAKAHVLLARILRRLGDESAARAAFDAALIADPTSFDALLERGNVLRGLGEPALAAASYTSAMETRPMDARPALALARLWEEQPGRDAEEQAAIAFQRALDRAGSAPEPASAMAGLCRDLARFRMDRAELPKALESLRQARFLAGSGELTALIDLDLAEVYLRLGMTTEAQALMEPLSGSDDPALLRALAQLAYRFNFWAEAVMIFERWTARHPNDAQAHLELADMQLKSWLLEEALASLNRAEACGPVPQAGSAALRASIANRLGDADTALRLYEGLVAEGQGSFAPNAAMSLLYADSVTPDDVARRHRALFAGWGQNARARESFDVDRDPDRPLRIGMVSGDLHHQHPVNIFLQPLLARWDHADLPLTIYSTGQTVDDQTRLARSRVRTWHDVSTAQLPARVHADNIDILIDLAGHTAGGSMRAFAQRMAPVQASFLGYPGSTGVPNIDWLIGDRVVTPPAADHLCSERVMRLPNTVFCFAPEVDYPLPDFGKLSRGRPLTFGSFNNIPKLTPRTLRLWADVLKAVPDSQLLLRAPSFKDAGAIARFQRLFADLGIPAERLIFRGPVGLDVMMQSYAEVDIALDPFPYCGGTTTLQALWMGVPVLTMAGGQFVSRMGASFMTAAGLPDWVAKDDDAYVAQAVALGRDRKALVGLKRGLRAQLQTRPGWNADRYAADFGAALRSIWRETMGQPAALG